MRSRVILLVLAWLLPASLAQSDPADAKAVATVSVQPDSFNPKLGQKATLEVLVVSPGSLSVSVLNSFGVAVRTLPTLQATPGKVSFTWDGRNDQGVVVPDDAYSISVRLSGDVIYEPRSAARSPNEAPVPIYSRVGGLISYTLRTAAYVTLSAVQDAVEEGSPPLVLRRIIDREPRTAGAVVETWTGFGPAGDYLPNVKGFRLDLVAEPLPENALITVGSRKRPINPGNAPPGPAKQGTSTTAAVSREAAK